MSSFLPKPSLTQTLHLLPKPSPSSSLGNPRPRLLRKPSPTPKILSRMAYAVGRTVEVMIPELGFEDSFYRAKILTYSRRRGYFVEFKSLLDDNGKDPSRRYVEEKDIRPIPKQIMIGEFAAGDLVDASLRDGWWAGKVLGKSGELYVVSFNRGTEELKLPWKSLRVHQEFFGQDIWIFTKKDK